MISRRRLLQACLAAPALLGGYAVGVEPFRVIERRYRPIIAGWPPDLPLRIVALSDFHAAEPWMSAARIRAIVADANALSPDIVLLLGDYVDGPILATRRVPDAEWATALGALRAPLGVHAILGNHDWWRDRAAQRRRAGPTSAGDALEAAGIPIYENRAIRLEKDGHGFWLAGLGDQWAFRPRGAGGADDLRRTLSHIADDAPTILMAHEPDVFPRLPDRFALTLAGHTHARQVTFLGYAPIVPSRYGARYRHGHFQEGQRHMIVTAGLGTTILPVRLGAPPEIAIIELGRRRADAARSAM